MPPSRDDFARWKDDFVTRWIMAAHQAAANANMDAWTKASWENGVASPVLLQDLRTRADAYMAIGQTTYEGFCEMLGEEPRED